MSVRSIRLRSGAPERHTLAPGQLAYFHVDIPRGRRCTLHLRMEKAGGDPVLMASANQWPVVDLEDADDMVRAHCCAFEAFEADAALHLLSIPDAGAHAPPAHPSAATPGGFPALPAGVAVRWAVGVFNFDLVKREACALTLEAHVGALDGRAPAPAVRAPRRALTTTASTHTPPRALGSPRPLAPGAANSRLRGPSPQKPTTPTQTAPEADAQSAQPRRGRSAGPPPPVASPRSLIAAARASSSRAPSKLVPGSGRPTHDENGRRIDHATPATQVAAAPAAAPAASPGASPRGRTAPPAAPASAAPAAALLQRRVALHSTLRAALPTAAATAEPPNEHRSRPPRRRGGGVRNDRARRRRDGRAAGGVVGGGAAEAAQRMRQAGRRAGSAPNAERAAREDFGAAAAEAAATGTKAALRWTRQRRRRRSRRAGAEAAAARAAVAEQAAAAEAARRRRARR